MYCFGYLAVLKVQLLFEASAFPEGLADLRHREQFRSSVVRMARRFSWESFLEPPEGASNLSRAWRWASKACLRRCSGVYISLEYTSRAALMAQKRARVREQEIGCPLFRLYSKPKGPEPTGSCEEVDACRILNPRA